jgi:hypothetical protein
MTQVAGGALLPCKAPWKGMRDPSLSIVKAEFPKEVQMWCFMF